MQHYILMGSEKGFATELLGSLLYGALTNL